MTTNKFPMYLDYGVKTLLVLLIVLAILGSIYLMTNAGVKEKSILTFDGVDYNCTFYYDGDMICKGVNDVNVGAERISP